MQPTVKGDPNCVYCRGSGIVYDMVPYGSTYVRMPSDCECIQDQLDELESESNVTNDDERGGIYNGREDLS